MSGEFFDEIVSGLKREAARGRAIRLTPEVAGAFFADASRPEPAPAETPRFRPPQAVPPPAAAPRQPPPDPAAAPAAPPVPRANAPVAELDFEQLRAQTLNCRECRLCEGRTTVVFGEGDPHARLMFVGEGPGRDEDLQGRPFVGEAGQLLTRMIQAMQFTREEVYIANIVKCRPPKNRNPQDDEAAACLKYLRRQIELVQPEVIVTLGSVPLRFLLETDGITRNRGRWFEYRGIPVMPTFHPAYLLRDPSKKRETWADLQQVMARFGKSYPGRQS